MPLGQILARKWQIPQLFLNDTSDDARTIIIGIVLFLLRENTEAQGKITIPYFALLFISVAIFNSFNLLPQLLVNF